MKAFIYLTYKCNLRCRYCYLGERLERPVEMALTTLESILEDLKPFHPTIVYLGGEPILYPHLEEAVELAKRNKYFVALDTNASYSIEEIPEYVLQNVDLFSVSIDSLDEKVMRTIRIGSNLNKILKVLSYLRKFAKNVRVTITVGEHNYGSVIETIKGLYRTYGIEEFNIHLLSMNGYALKNGLKSLEPERWINLIERFFEMEPLIRFPLSYIPKKSQRRNIIIEYLKNYCSIRKFDRISIMPDGKVYICSLLFDTEFNIGEVRNKEIVVKNSKNELYLALKNRCPAEVYGFHPDPRYINICRFFKVTNRDAWVLDIIRDVSRQNT